VRTADLDRPLLVVKIRELGGSPLIIDGYALLVIVRVLLAFAAVLADSIDEVDVQDPEEAAPCCVPQSWPDAMGVTSFPEPAVPANKVSSAGRVMS
jgi:hypothetical protein